MYNHNIFFAALADQLNSLSGHAVNGNNINEFKYGYNTSIIIGEKSEHITRNQTYLKTDQISCG